MAMPNYFSQLESSAHRFPDRYHLCFHFLLVTMFVFFITPLISIPLIGAYLILCGGKYNKNEFLISALFLMIVVFLFVIIFSCRTYGFNIGDTSDDVPGYYRWYLHDISDWTNLLFNREFVFWLPFLLASTFYEPLGFQEFTLLSNTYFFTILYFAFIRFGRFSVAFIFIWFFLFHANIYGLAHIYRQTLALLFLILSVSSYFDNYKKRTYFFCVLSFFSHNASIIFIVPFLIITSLNPKSVLSYFKILFSILFISSILLFVSDQAMGEILYKLNFYTMDGGEASKRGFDLQSIFIILLNGFLFFNVKNKKIRRVLIAAFLIQVAFLLVGLWSFIARINLFILPITIYLYFICVKNNLFILVKNSELITAGIFCVMLFGIFYTLRIGINNLQAIVPLLANGELFNLDNGFVSILQKL